MFRNKIIEPYSALIELIYRIMIHVLTEKESQPKENTYTPVHHIHLKNHCLLGESFKIYKHFISFEMLESVWDYEVNYLCHSNAFTFAFYLHLRL